MTNLETLVCDGGSLKALDDAGRVGGHLVLFGSPEEPDATTERDYFTAETDFWAEFPFKSVVLYHHGLDATLGPRKLGDAELKTDAAGVWMEAQLKLRDDYERKVYRAVVAGKMGLSSGSVSHLVRRERQENGTHKITSWPLFEASITPTPGEPRTRAVALKSLMDDIGSPVPGESFVDTCLRTASELEQAACRFAKIGPVKMDAMKALRASLDTLIRTVEHRPDPAAIQASAVIVNDLLVRLGSR
jgi:hypothetical protein